MLAQGFKSEQTKAPKLVGETITKKLTPNFQLFSLSQLFSFAAAPARRRHPPRRGRGRPQGRGPGKDEVVFSLFLDARASFETVLKALARGGEGKTTRNWSRGPSGARAARERDESTFRAQAEATSRDSTSRNRLLDSSPFRDANPHSLVHGLACRSQGCDLESLLYSAALVGGE